MRRRGTTSARSKCVFDDLLRRSLRLVNASSSCSGVGSRRRQRSPRSLHRRRWSSAVTSPLGSSTSREGSALPAAEALEGGERVVAPQRGARLRTVAVSDGSSDRRDGSSSRTASGARAQSRAARRAPPAASAASPQTSRRRGASPSAPCSRAAARRRGGRLLRRVPAADVLGDAPRAGGDEEAARLDAPQRDRQVERRVRARVAALEVGLRGDQAGERREVVAPDGDVHRQVGGLERSGGRPPGVVGRRRRGGWCCQWLGVGDRLCSAASACGAACCCGSGPASSRYAVARPQQVGEERCRVRRARLRSSTVKVSPLSRSRTVTSVAGRRSAGGGDPRRRRVGLLLRCAAGKQLHTAARTASGGAARGRRSRKSAVPTVLQNSLHSALRHLSPRRRSARGSPRSARRRHWPGFAVVVSPTPLLPPREVDERVPFTVGVLPFRGGGSSTVDEPWWLTTTSDAGWSHGSPSSCIGMSSKSSSLRATTWAIRFAWYWRRWSTLLSTAYLIACAAEVEADHLEDACRMGGRWAVREVGGSRVGGVGSCLWSGAHRRRWTAAANRLCRAGPGPTGCRPPSATEC